VPAFFPGAFAVGLAAALAAGLLAAAAGAVAAVAGVAAVSAVVAGVGVADGVDAAAAAGDGIAATGGAAEAAPVAVAPQPFAEHEAFPAGAVTAGETSLAFTGGGALPPHPTRVLVPSAAMTAAMFSNDRLGRMARGLLLTQGEGA
jgi:hypothetical protein